jgi:hypothetical protein
MPRIHIPAPSPWAAVLARVHAASALKDRLAAIGELLSDGADAAMLPQLQELIAAETHKTVRKGLIASLAVFGPAAVEPLLDLLGSRELPISELRSQTLSTLRPLRDSARPAILAALTARHMERRLGAVLAVRGLYPREELTLLIPGLQDTHPVVRRTAVIGLGDSSSREALAALLPLVRGDPDATVRQAARDAIRSLYRHLGEKPPPLPTARDIARDPLPRDPESPPGVPWERPYSWQIDERTPVASYAAPASHRATQEDVDCDPPDGDDE